MVTALRFARRPSWATFDIFLFFTAIAMVLLAADVGELLGIEGHPTLRALTWIGVTALPFILLRLVDDFRPQRAWLMASASLLYALVAVLGLLTPQPWPPPVLLAAVAFFVTLGGYASLAFLRESLRSSGITRRRMQAVALGSGLLALILLLTGVNVVLPLPEEARSLVNQVLALSAGLMYFAGFAPPAILRRAWQEPAIRALLDEAADLVQLPDTRAIARRIEARAVSATGADGAAVGLWEEPAGEIVFRGPSRTLRMRPGEYIGGRAFERQEVIFSAHAERDAPEHAAEYERSGFHAVAAAPISSGKRRLGVLLVYAQRPPAFTDDVLSLVEVIAEQAALVVRSHQLLQEAARVRAQAEVTRLKDDFLSVVAHDVRTPLTTILINAELLEQALSGDGRNARRAASLRTEGLRLKQLVEDYLDVVRAEEGSATRLEPHDLVELVRDAIAGMGPGDGRVTVTGEASLPGAFDAPRIQQLVQNLISNALKYSASQAPVEVRLEADADAAVLTVTDHGIGIPEGDLALLFERFHRGSNTNDRRYAGLGLGLYICRQIAEEHGGSIAVSSRVGVGTTFTVWLPLAPAGVSAAGGPA